MRKKLCLKHVFLLMITLLFAVPTTFGQERIRIGISTKSLGFLPTIVAEKKGFYHKYDLTSEHIYLSLAIAMNALLNEDLDYAISVGQGVTAAIKGFPVKLGMMTQDKLVFFLLVKPGIEKVTDLKGKTVGISYPGSTTHLVVTMILRHFDLEPGKDVSILPSGDDQGRLMALDTGRVEAAIGSPPMDILGAKKGYKVLVWARDYIPIPQNAVILSDKKLRQSPGQIKRMFKGTIEALRFIRERKEEAIDIAADWLKSDRSTTRSMVESYLPAYSVDGTMTDQALRAAIEVELDRAKIKKEVSISQVADRTLISEAQKELALK